MQSSLLQLATHNCCKIQNCIFCPAKALGYLQKCPEFSLPRAVATRALGALGLADTSERMFELQFQMMLSGRRVAEEGALGQGSPVLSQAGLHSPRLSASETGGQ